MRALTALCPSLGGHSIHAVRGFMFLCSMIKCVSMQLNKITSPHPGVPPEQPPVLCGHFEFLSRVDKKRRTRKTAERLWRL